MAIVLMAMSSFDIEFPWNFNEPYLAYLKLLLNSFFADRHWGRARKASSWQPKPNRRMLGKLHNKPHCSPSSQHWRLIKSSSTPKRSGPHFFAGRMFLMFLLVCQFTGKPAESWLLRIAAMPVYWQGSRQCLCLGCCDASLLATQLCLG